MLIDRLQQDLNASLKAGKSIRVETIRFLIAAVRNAAIAKYWGKADTSLTDADIVEVVKKQIKTHKESIEAFKKAGRTELVDKEKQELEILLEFAPKEISDDELKKILEPIAALEGAIISHGLIRRIELRIIDEADNGGSRRKSRWGKSRHDA